VQAGGRAGRLLPRTPSLRFSLQWAIAPDGDAHSKVRPLFQGSILLLLIDAALIAHVIKTGRNQLWIWAILVPGVGAVAYFAAEVLPELFSGRTGRRATAGVRRMIDPNRDLRRASAEVEISGNVDARRRLGEELYERNQYDEAIEVYRSGLKGIFEYDPTLLLSLARAQFGKQDYAAARATLELLAQHNPDFKSADAKLLYARTLESQDSLDEAEREYAMVAPGYPGAEARLRYGLLLKRRGKLPEAHRVLKDLLDGARLGPAHYRRAQAEWLDRARREMS